MTSEIKRIAHDINEVFSGDPWYGKSISTVLNEIKPETVYKKPSPGTHSLIELLYHLITWSDFTKSRLEKDQDMEPQALNILNWRETNPDVHTWNHGIAQLTLSTNKIIKLLDNYSDDLLEEIVDFRNYNFRFLLHGLIQHNVYHLGQMVYIQKLLS